MSSGSFAHDHLTPQQRPAGSLSRQPIQRPGNCAGPTVQPLQETGQMLTQRQTERLHREAKRTARSWQADCRKTGRTMTDDRAQRIARQEASYCDHIAKDTDAITAIFYQHLKDITA